MSMLRFSLKVGAPAVVVLATVVNAAAASDHVLASAQTPDLSWALQGGATHGGRMTRAYLARRAATAIRTLDQISSAAKTPCDALGVAQPAAMAGPGTTIVSPAQQPAHSTHQHSAP
ncbi:MAG: hypothetical protein NTW87_04895 [Planctomycetota bacterium]|nr:hypothetical protein [Planctomycetota bacterium]